MTIGPTKNKRDTLGIKLLAIDSSNATFANLSSLTLSELPNNCMKFGKLLYNQNLEANMLKSTINDASIHVLVSHHPMREMDSAALVIQKVYKSYRTRRNLADCAVFEELWWKALDFAFLKHRSVSFYDDNKQETALSRWARAGTRAAMVGKGLSKSDKAIKLTLQHWLEAIDPRHRYGHNLHLYYNVWFESESIQPFFYWLDVGNGKEVNLAKCQRSSLHRQCIKYLRPKEREAYEVIINKGRLVYKQAKSAVHTTDGAKWIFVLSTSKALYVGPKIKGKFQHSSFLSGGAITAAGRLVVMDGFLKAIWSYSGHYLPTEENFKEFINFLGDNNVDLTNVKTYSIDDDEISSSFKKSKKLQLSEKDQILAASLELSDAEDIEDDVNGHHKVDSEKENNVGELSLNVLTEPISQKWNTDLGPRIGCVREYF